MLGESPEVPPSTPLTETKEGRMGLGTLPYDLLLNIATYLDLRDVHALHLIERQETVYFVRMKGGGREAQLTLDLSLQTSKSLYDASTTRPVYRKLANDLLRRCRALPLKGFQRLSDLSTEHLIHSVNKASHYEAAWRVRAPRPICPVPYKNGINSRSNYLDVAPKSRLAEKAEREGNKWYKIVSAPPGENVDWLSPITSSYTLCATKSGKVVCWDVQSDTCLAEWNPGPGWELWKCRVEFEERTVFFTMAKVLAGSYDDNRVMKFVLMRLTFSDGPSGESSPSPPVFSHVTEFQTTGVVMNVFLLDPSERLLSAFIWVSTSNTIGLYALPDWSKKEYVFIDTGIECVMSSNWSCILYQQHIVIHCEESDAAYQHFYPLSLLQIHITKLSESHTTPLISRRLAPSRTLKKKFIFPLIVDMTDSEPDLDADMQSIHNDGDFHDTFAHASSSINSIIPIQNGGGDSQSSQQMTSILSSPSSSSSSSSSSGSALSSSSSIAPPPTNADNPNPYPFPPWYPESAHFVRQWWPSLPNIPRVSCTVVLLAEHDQHSQRPRFVLAQHYFRVPLDHAKWNDGMYRDPAAAAANINGNGKQKAPEKGKTPEGMSGSLAQEYAQDDALMHLWYVSTPFEVVRVIDGTEEEAEENQERPRPLVAVDFGHAVWVEYDESDSDDRDRDRDRHRNRGRDRDRGRVDDDERTPSSDDDDDDSSISSEAKKSLRFVTFPAFSEEHGVVIDKRGVMSEAEVRTLETPSELDLNMVETINIDQSQGAIILSDKTGRIFILCYE